MDTAPESVAIVGAQNIGRRKLQIEGDRHSDTQPLCGKNQVRCFWTEAGNRSRTTLWRIEYLKLDTYKAYVDYGTPTIGQLGTDAPFSILRSPSSTGRTASNPSTRAGQATFNQGASQCQLSGTFKNPCYIQETTAAHDTIVVVEAGSFERVTP